MKIGKELVEKGGSAWPGHDEERPRNLRLRYLDLADHSQLQARSPDLHVVGAIETS